MTVQQAIEEFIERMTMAFISLEDTIDLICANWPEEEES